MARRISLANKCQLLFGVAALAIVAAALSVPWMRETILVREYQLEVARQVADRWLVDRRELGDRISLDGDDRDPLRISLVRLDDIEPDEESAPFLTAALKRFRDNPEKTEYLTTTIVDGQAVYRYARAITESRLRSTRNPSITDFSPGVVDPGVADPLRAILIIDRTSEFAESQLLLSRVYIIAAGLIATLAALLVFHVILKRLIYSPVRKLRDTTESVQGGQMSIRSTLRTGDEFQQLSEAFNAMLERLEQSQAQLKAVNDTLDLKLNQLAEANIGLYESNRLKSEFLANVSHELRTPLNSIIGFAELLLEMAKTDPAADPKRPRYLSNILSSGRSLLDMINELLEMAKIEAGRMEVNVEPTSISDLVEGLLNIMRPQAEARTIELRAQVAPNLPVVETDPGKLQQILYNFLSNAIKFTPGNGTVTVTADVLSKQGQPWGVRLGVADTGPGIPYDMQEMIFEKFRQIDASHTKAHAGTGLGLAICRELAELLGASVSLVSEPGRGATFFVDLPLTHQSRKPQALMA